MLIIFLSPFCHVYSQRESFSDIRNQEDNIVIENGDKEVEHFDNEIRKNGRSINLFTSKFFINYSIPFLLPVAVYFLYFLSFTKSQSKFRIVTNLSILILFACVFYFQYSFRNLNERQFIYQSIFDDSFNLKFYQEGDENSKISEYLVNESNEINMKYISISTYVFDIVFLFYLTALTIFLYIEFNTRLRSNILEIAAPKPIKYFLNIKNLKSKFN